MSAIPCRGALGVARKGAPNLLATSNHCRTHPCGGKPRGPVILCNRTQAADRNVDLGTEHIPDRALTIPPLAAIERQHLVLDEFSDAPQCLGRPLGVLPHCAWAHRGLQFAPGSHVRQTSPKACRCAVHSRCDSTGTDPGCPNCRSPLRPSANRRWHRPSERPAGGLSSTSAATRRQCRYT